MGRLAGRRVLVTGGASGIGLATAELCVEEGATVAVLDRDRAGLEHAARWLGVHPCEVDLLDEDRTAAAVHGAVSALGGLDGVVNVAGVDGGGQRLEDVDLATWQTVLGVNLTAPALVSREALPHLRRNDSATIVNVASGQGLVPSAPGMAAYCASKGGLVMLGRTLALELAPVVRVNTVCPGIVDTPLLPDSFRTAGAGPGSPYALERIAAAGEVAAAIVFLTSHESSFVTGTAMAVDGGRTYH